MIMKTLTKQRQDDRNLPDMLLRGTSLQAADAARFVLEIWEMLGTATKGAAKEDVLKLMRRAMRLGLQSIQEEEITVSFAQAVRASLEARAERRPMTVRDLRYFTNRMLRVEGIGERPLRAMRAQECRSLLLRCFGGSRHSYRKARAILHSIFAFGLRQGWCAHNPVDRIEVPAVKENPIEPLSADAVNRLEQVARCPLHSNMQLSLHLMLYCGVRPQEVQRLDPLRDIDWKHRQVLIRPQTSKTGGGRVIPLRKAYCVQPECRAVIPRNWLKRWRALRRDAGFQHWKADVCRHTFASYHAWRFRNLSQLQLEMGHRNTRLLQSRYVMACLGTDACEFWK